MNDISTLRITRTKVIENMTEGIKILMNIFRSFHTKVEMKPACTELRSTAIHKSMQVLWPGNQ